VEVKGLLDAWEGVGKGLVDYIRYMYIPKSLAGVSRNHDCQDACVAGGMDPLSLRRQVPRCADS
jgi:hypothetical protein